MFLLVATGWLFLSLITICIMAYNPYTDRFHWDLCEGEEPAGWVRYAMWGLVILLMPRFLMDTLAEKALDTLTLSVGITKIRMKATHQSMR